MTNIRGTAERTFAIITWMPSHCQSFTKQFLKISGTAPGWLDDSWGGPKKRENSYQLYAHALVFFLFLLVSSFHLLIFFFAVSCCLYIDILGCQRPSKFIYSRF
jgi:hypothetical protein